MKKEGKSPKKTKKQPTLGKLKTQFWDVFSLYIKKKYTKDGILKCYTCGAELVIGTSNCQGGHYYTKKGFPALYFHENNVRTQCYHCNISLGGNVNIFREKLLQEIGEEGIRELDEKRHGQIKITKSEYLNLISIYKEKIKEYE